ncbi:MAG: hypothetical protein CVV42_03025 [Candidatus Riflebacteria bacterium HGW-Riflebacteria-2]|jgi:hypothetical protein|nr:MAG: hypothetical protein CVV42_03025 [Candidatus Riflebacteria bacterium HGW-Riflebacteria-2]
MPVIRDTEDKSLISLRVETDEMSPFRLFKNDIAEVRPISRVVDGKSEIHLFRDVEKDQLLFGMAKRASPDRIIVYFSPYSQILIKENDSRYTIVGVLARSITEREQLPENAIKFELDQDFFETNAYWKSMPDAQDEEEFAQQAAREDAAMPTGKALQSSFYPWAASDKDCVKEAMRMCVEGIVKKVMLETPRTIHLSPAYRAIRARDLLGRQAQLEELEAGERGGFLLQCLFDCAECRLTLPEWIVKEFRDIKEFVSSSKAKSKKDRDSGWNNPRAFGYPYAKGANLNIEKENQKLAAQTWALLEIAKNGPINNPIVKRINRKSGDDKFDEVADILKEMGLNAKSGGLIKKSYDRWFGKKFAKQYAEFLDAAKKVKKIFSA